VYVTHSTDTINIQINKTTNVLCWAAIPWLQTCTYMYNTKYTLHTYTVLDINSIICKVERTFTLRVQYRVQQVRVIVYNPVAGLTTGESIDTRLWNVYANQWASIKHNNILKVC